MGSEMCIRDSNMYSYKNDVPPGAAAVLLVLLLIVSKDVYVTAKL